MLPNLCSAISLVLKVGLLQYASIQLHRLFQFDQPLRLCLKHLVSGDDLRDKVSIDFTDIRLKGSA